MPLIKYKVFYRVDKQIYDVVRLDFYKTGKYCKAYFVTNNNLTSAIVIDYSDGVVNGDLMRFTGKKDKDRTEIYGGHILEYDGERCSHCGELQYNKHKPYLVSWNDEDACFEITNDENYMDNSLCENSMKIIGNKFQDKELLKGD